MVQFIGSDKVYEKVKQELAKYQIDMTPDSAWVLVEQGYDIPIDKPCIVFDAIDYMDVVKLLVSGVREDIQHLNTLTGLSGNRFTVIEPKDVYYLEAGPDGLTAHTKSNRYGIKETLQHYEILWGAKGFLRVNKSQMVNLLHVKEIVPWFNSRYVLRLDNDAELEVSKMFSKKLRNTLKI